MNDVLVAGVPRLIDDVPFARGGEGSLHAFADGPDRCVVKRYARTSLSDTRRQRVHWLIGHPPQRVDTQLAPRSQLAMAWPQAEVTLPNGDFIGITIPRVRGAVRLSELTAHPRTVSTRLGIRWQPWELSSSMALRLRMLVARRIAQLVSALHATRRYVVVDLKPDNVLVNARGDVVLVDCDSVQVVHAGHMQFAARTRTDEYTPPEGFDSAYQMAWDAGRPVAPSWDDFSLAVIAYQLLVGIHPFAVRGRDPATGEPIDSIAEAIRARLFAHGRARGSLASRPAQHDAFDALPAELRTAFFRTLDTGAHDPSARVTTAEWKTLLARHAGQATRWLSTAQAAAAFSAGARRSVASLRLRLAGLPVEIGRTIRAKNRSLLGRLSIARRRLVAAKGALAVMLVTTVFGYAIANLGNPSPMPLTVDVPPAELPATFDRCNRWTGLPNPTSAIGHDAMPDLRIGDDPSARMRSTDTHEEGEAAKHSLVSGAALQLRSSAWSSPTPETACSHCATRSCAPEEGAGSNSSAATSRRLHSPTFRGGEVSPRPRRTPTRSWTAIRSLCCAAVRAPGTVGLATLDRCAGSVPCGGRWPRSPEWCRPCGSRSRCRATR